MHRHDRLASGAMAAFAMTAFGAVAGCGLLHRHPAAPPPPYRLTDLPPLPGGKTSQVMSLNDAGAVVGRADFAGSHGHQHAVEWRSGVPRDLGTLDGGGSEADAVTPEGRIVGWSSYNAVNIHACEFGPSAPRDLGSGTYKMSLAFGVSDDGRIGIARSVASGAVHSFLIDSARAVDLGVLPGFRDMTGSTLAPNATVVGVADDGRGGKCAFQWSNGKLTALKPLPGDSNSYANGISRRGIVAGSSSQGTQHFHAAIWIDGVPQALPSPPGKDSEAFAADDMGDVVGECNNHACLWRKGQLIDLNLKIGKHGKMVLNSAVAIDGSSAIACNGLVNSQIHAFLLTPNNIKR